MNPSLAMVDENGAVTLVSLGTATIRATSLQDQSKYGSWAITVTSGIDRIRVAPAATNIIVSNTLRFTVTVIGPNPEKALLRSVERGTLDLGNLYTAPGTAGPDTACWMAVADMTKVACAAIVVEDVPPPPEKATIAFFRGYTDPSCTAISENTCHNIFAVRPDGTGLVQLTTDIWQEIGPAWSPDGTKIAFSWNQPSSSTNWIMDPDGSNQRMLTSPPAGMWDLWPSWSPDGNRILFRSNRSGSEQFWRVDAEGNNLLKLTDEPPNNCMAAGSWSVTGRITFHSCRDGNLEIYVMDEDGTNRTRLTTSTSSNVGPVMNADGSGIVLLTFNTVTDGHPAWSPNGSQIVFGRDMGTTFWDLFVMNADGSSQANITNTPAVHEAFPSWGR
jgi:hypothetical protein